jgi:CBS domain-containing protein/sporulation protein YlmC with PRC-barrel domain
MALGDNTRVSLPLLVNLSLLLGTPMVDAAGHKIGRLREVAVMPGPNSDVVTSLILGKKSRSATAEGGEADLQAIDPAGIQWTPGGTLQLLGGAQVRPFSMTEAVLLLDRDLMDQQIIDVHGRKVVRVNDVGLLWIQQEGGAEVHTVEVEVGARGAVRRMLKGLVPRALVDRIAARFPSRGIPWKFVDLVEVDPARRVRLKIDHERLARLHPSDIADILEDLAPAQREAVFSTLDEEVAAEALEEVDPKFQKSLVEALGSEQMADIVEEMDPGAAADMLAELPEERSEAILEEMEPAERQEVEELLEFRENSAAGRMTTHYVAVPVTATVADAVEALRNFEDDPETVTEIYLVDDKETLAGVVPLGRLVLAKPETHLDVLTDAGFVSCLAKAHQKEVAELFDKYNLHALPVVDEMHRLVGVVQADHVIAFLRDAE